MYPKPSFVMVNRSGLSFENNGERRLTPLACAGA